jgi:hypothetical protein
MLRVVLMNGLWIVGLSIIVASLSYFRYQAVIQDLPLRRQFTLPSFQVAVYLGVILIGLGLAGTSETAWEAVIWFAFSLIALTGAVRAGRSPR